MKKINWTKGMTSRQSVRKSFEQRLEESLRQREKGTEETVGDKIS